MKYYFLLHLFCPTHN